MKPISAKVVVRATARLLSLETLYQQCEIVAIDSDGHPDDDLLLGYLDAATDWAEKFTGRALRIQTFEFALDEFPTRANRWLCEPSAALSPGIEIPYPPLIEVERFAYGDDSDSELELADDFTVDTYGDKAVLRAVSSWPSVTRAPNVITCRYRAGYSGEVDPDSDAEPLPGAVKAALLILVESMHANRGTLAQEAQDGAEALLRPFRVLLGMA